MKQNIENNPLVSVIVVCFNHGKYLEKNLDSIRFQSYSPIEIIIADDFSSDSSKKIIEEYLDKNKLNAITVFNQKNIGLAATLNNCVPMCRGKYVKIIAADDYLHTDYFTVCVNEMERLGEEYGLLYTNVITVDDKEKVTKDFADYDLWKNLSREEIRNSLKKINKISAASAFMAAKALNQTGPYNENILIEDYDRWLRINEKFWIYYYPKKLVYYRRHAENASQISYNQLFQEGLTLRIKFDKKGENNISINGDVRSLYYTEKPLSKELFQAFTFYKYREKLLYYSLKFHIPKSIYHFLRNLSVFINRK